MRDRFNRALLVATVVLLAMLLVQPYVDRWLVTGRPQPVVARADLSDAEQTAARVFEQASPAVVQVAARAHGAPALGLQPDGGGGVQSGTGFIWDQSGHVVTNEHVVRGADAMMIRFVSGEIMGARLVGTAPNYDLAVLQLAGRLILPAPIPLGSSADLKVGQWAFAIGNPFGLDQSLTSGIVSALKRRMPTSGGREITGVVQTDAAINPGNSGGPLLDSAGRLIGVNTAIFSPSGANTGIGFAIPVDVVNRVVPQLIRDGRVPTPGIGIIAASEEVAARLGVEGVVIVRAAPGSPAARSGLQGVDMDSGTLGDVIVAANGKPVRRLADLTDEIERVGVGGEIELTVQRGGDSRTVRVGITDIG